MKTTILAVRHGESLANHEKCFAGQLDYPLTALGREQAELTAQYLEQYRLDAVYASDLSRAFETGKIIAAHQHLTVIPDAALREIYAGKWQGRKFDDLERDYPEQYGRWKTSIGCLQTPEGESTVEMAHRVCGELERLAEQYQGKTICLATHATPIRMMQCLWSGIPFERAAEIPWTSNASVTIAEKDETGWHCIVSGLNGHLGGKKTFFPPNV